MMTSALHSQRAGRASEAAERYRRVLAADPSNYDATHMLALIEYEAGRYEAAISLLRRAIELRPDLGIAKHNLRLIESMPQIEDGVCREIVPRLAARIEPVRDVARFAPSAAAVHITLIDEGTANERSMFERLCRAFAPRPVQLWTHGDAARGSPARPIAASAGDHPKGGLLVLLGRTLTQTMWLEDAHPERILLAIVGDEACGLIDRIDEASLYDPKPGVVCASARVADRLGLPSTTLISPAENEQRP